MTIEQIELGKMYYLPVRVTEFNHEVGDEEPTVRLVNLSGRHDLVGFGKNIMNELVEIDLRINKLKPVVPQFVADKYEEFKHDFENFLINLCWESRAFESVFNTSFGKWFKNSENAPIKTLINMDQYGYTVEKEKLYTVEIPNPNTISTTALKKSNVGDVVMCYQIDNYWKNNSRYQLTEAEIRKDFDWAWEQGFAKEVTE